MEVMGKLSSFLIFLKVAFYKCSFGRRKKLGFMFIWNWDLCSYVYVHNWDLCSYGTWIYVHINVHMEGEKTAVSLAFSTGSR